MPRRALPTLATLAAAPTDSDCAGCSRREAVQGLGVIAASLLLGCGGDDGEPVLPDAAVVAGGHEMCGPSWCVDLADPANEALRQVEGTRAISIPGDKIVIVRTSMTAFAVLSRVCTHNGCSVAYRETTGLLVCPCHGSRFELTGDVAQGPADLPLRTYATSFDEATQLLTITL